MYRWPLDLPISISGNFGELRNNHFHSGLDIRTDGKEGFPVHAVADGYVSRIKISPFGYGKALYVTHNNGVVSVYAHLQSFCDTIEQYIRTQQYKEKSFEIELFPKAGQFFFRKGEVLAFSGNTGGSEGPHLHFELRDEKTEWALNPLTHGYTLPDSVAPVFTGIRIVPINDASSVNGKREPVELRVVRKGKNFLVMPADTPVVHGTIGFMAEVFDYENGDQNRNGLYRLDGLINNRPFFSSSIDAFPFDLTRQVNAHIDYASKKLRGDLYERCYVLPGNTLPFYSVDARRGYLGFSYDSVYLMRLSASDARGNTLDVSFPVKGSSVVSFVPPVQEKRPPAATFHFHSSNEFQRAGLRMNLPRGALFDDLDFYFSVRDSTPGFYSPVYQLQDETVPLAKAAELSIKASRVPPALRSKLCLASVSGNRLVYEKSHWNESTESVVGEVKSFGRFVLAPDTTPPVISSTNLSVAGKNNPDTLLRIKVWDSFSGIKDYQVFLDGVWTLFEYDAKNNVLLRRSRVAEAPLVFSEMRVVVTDYRGNTRTRIFGKPLLRKAGGKQKRSGVSKKKRH